MRAANATRQTSFFTSLYFKNNILVCEITKMETIHSFILPRPISLYAHPPPLQPLLPAAPPEGERGRGIKRVGEREREKESGWRAVRGKEGW